MKKRTVVVSPVRRNPDSSAQNDLHNPASQRWTPSVSFRFSASPNRETSPNIASSNSRIGSPDIERAGPSDDLICEERPSKVSKLRADGIVAKGDIVELMDFLFDMSNEEAVDYIETEKFGSVGNTLLHIAVREKKVEIIRYFRTLGVSLEVYNFINQTPLHYAAQFGSDNAISSDQQYRLNEEVIAELFKFKNVFSLLDKKDNVRNTPRFYAEECRKKNGKKNAFLNVETREIFSKVDSESKGENFDEEFYNKFYCDGDEKQLAFFKGVAEARKQYKEEEAKKLKEEQGANTGCIPAYVLGQ